MKTKAPSTPWVLYLSMALALLAPLAACNSLPVDAGKDIHTASDETSTQRRARIKLELASAYFSRGELPTALDEVKQSIALNPGSADAFDLRGLIYAALGKDDLAADSYREALRIDPSNGDTLHNYGWFRCLRGQYPEADGLFAKALAVSQYREVTRTLLARGVCQARAGKLAEAEATLQRSYQLDPSNPAVGTNLANVLYREHQYERARFYIGRVNDNPDLSNAETLWLAARIERKLHNDQAFRDLAAQLRSRFPSSPETLALDQGRFDD